MTENLDDFNISSRGGSHLVVYLDVSTGRIYNEKGELYRKNTLVSFLNASFILELHYIKKATIGDDPAKWDAWEGLGNQQVASTLSFDKDYLHSFLGAINSSCSAGDMELSVKFKNIKEVDLRESGSLFINPYGNSKKVIVSYSSFKKSYDSNVCTFQIDLDGGLPESVSEGTLVRIEAPLYLFINSNEIYEANIPNNYENGVFNIPIKVMSRKLLEELDSTNISGVSGKIEHNIYVTTQKLTGISVLDNTTFTRKIEQDAYASYNNELSLFCCWGNEETFYWTKGNSIEQNEALYLIDGSTAVLQEATANPIYNTELTLFKTFSFPCIIRNLIDYTTECVIPSEDVNWSEDYVVSVVKNNIDDIISGLNTGGQVTPSEQEDDPED